MWKGQDIKVARHMMRVIEKLRFHNDNDNENDNWISLSFSLRFEHKEVKISKR